MKTRAIVLFTLAAIGFASAPCCRGETPAEDAAREWYMALLTGKKDRVDGLTRVPFVCPEAILKTREQLQQYILKPIGAKAADEKLADLKPEMIKVKTLAKPKAADARMTQWLDEAGARFFVEVSIGKHTQVLYLTKGSKPKVVGLGKGSGKGDE
jgi:hypothetical protein